MNKKEALEILHIATREQIMSALNTLHTKFSFTRAELDIIAALGWDSETMSKGMYKLLS